MSDAALIQIPMSGGIDESFDDLRTPAGRMRTCSNAVFPSTNSIAKRGGFVPVPLVDTAGANIAQVKKVQGAGDVPLCFAVGTGVANVYGRSSAASRWVNHGRVPTCIATRQDLTTGFSAPIQVVSSSFLGQPMAFDVADANGLRCVVWAQNGTQAQGGGYFAVVLDAMTGEAVTPTILVDPVTTTTTTPNALIRVIGTGTAFFVVYQTTGQHFSRKYDTTTRAWGASTGVGFVSSGDWAFDVCANVGSGNGDWIFCWHDRTANQIKVQRFDSTGSSATAQFAVGATTAGANYSVAVRCTSGEVCWVAFVRTGIGAGVQNGSTATHNPSTMVQISAPVATILGITTGLDTVIGIERFSSVWALVTMGGTGMGLVWAIVSSATQQVAGFPATTSGLSDNDMRWTPISKPFVGPNGRAYIMVLDENAFAASQVLLELSTSNASIYALPAASVTARAAINNTTQSFAHLRSVNIASPGDYTATKFVTLGFAVNSQGTTGITCITFDFAHPGIYQAVTLGQSTYVTGGCLSCYDGQRNCDYGMLTYASKPTFVSSSTVGGQLGQHVYHYIVVTRYRNARGELVRSLPPTFDPFAVDFTASGTVANQVTMAIHQITIAQTKQDPPVGGVSGGNQIIHEIYRTGYTGAIEGPYYLCGVVANQLTVGRVNFTDLMSDGELTGGTKPILYTVGNALEWNQPPSTRFLATHNQRLFALVDEGKVIWYSTAAVTGECPRFNDQLKLSIPGGDGDLTALASFDGRLYAFTPRAMFVFSGDGPNDTGAAESWSAPIRLPFGVGCIDPRSVAVTPMGVAFLSAKGVYLLDRSGDCKWLGERFQRTLATYPVVTSILCSEADGLILFCLRASDTPGAPGIIVVWDYRHDCWATWNVATDASTSGAMSAVVVGGEIYAQFLASNIVTSTITKYTPKTYADATAAIVPQLLVVTGWVTPADLQGYARIARVLILERRISAHTLEVSSFVDYGQADKDVVFSDGQINTTFPGQVRFTPIRQKCESISIALADVASGSGAGPVLEGLLFKVRLKRGEYKHIKTGQGA